VLPKVDVIGKIQQLYMENRPVPYLTFMHVFNDLLADPKQTAPKQPSDELKEKFRAACMVANVGIIDTEGREEERVREFRDKVYPVWKAKMPPADFARYDEILQGKLREKRELQERQKQAAAEKQAADRSRQLMKKLGLLELEVAPSAPAPAPAEVPQPKSLPARFENVDELCKAIRAGQLKAEYPARGQESEIARYALDDLEVAVRLAQAGGGDYAILRVGVGRSSTPDALERIDGFAAEMRYLRMADYAYLRRDGDFAFTLTVGPTATNMACTAQQGAQNDLVRRIEKLHRDLGELVERIRR